MYLDSIRYQITESCVDAWGGDKFTGRAAERTSGESLAIATSLFPAITAHVAEPMTVSARDRLVQQTETVPLQ